MIAMQKKLLLWVGQKHCGKTTSAAELVADGRAEGFNVAGLLAPSIYRSGKLVGFDVLDLQTKTRAPLARRKQSKAGPFTFISDGLKLGNTSLSTEATKTADLIIVDEFGPLELKGQGWRKNVDSLLACSDALILLVVRQGLVDQVRQLYADAFSQKCDATEQNSINEVTSILRNHRQRD